MPKVSAEHLAARRFGILKAALKCFSRNGLHATSMKDICRAANLSPGAVYRYFDSKESLVEALAEDASGRIEEFIALSPTEEIHRDSLFERLEGLCDALERPENLETMRLDVLLWAESLRLPGVNRLHQEGRTSLHRSIAQLVLAAQAEGKLDASQDPMSVARCFLALFEGLAVQKVTEPELDLDPALAAARSLLGGLHPR